MKNILQEKEIVCLSDFADANQKGSRIGCLYRTILVHIIVIDRRPSPATGSVVMST